DQVTANSQVVDGAREVDRDADGRGPLDQLVEVGKSAELVEGLVARERRGQQRRRRTPAGGARLQDGVEEALMERLVEVGTAQAVADPLHDGVVVEQGAQKVLLGL